MKLAPVLALVAAATVVSAETNAQRFARGLPPNSPVRGKRATPALAARNGQPSGSPGNCNTGPIQCCNSMGTAGDGGPVDDLLGLLGIHISLGTSVGLNCDSISALGSGGNSCTQQPVCCDDNSFNGLINIGCSPINIDL